MAAGQGAPNAGHIWDSAPKEITGMIDTANRAIEYLDKAIPEIESSIVANKEELLRDMTDLRGIVQNIDERLRELDNVTDRDDKRWRGTSDRMDASVRAFAKVMEDSFYAFANSNYRKIPDEYKESSIPKYKRTSRAAADQTEESEALGGITVPTITYPDVAYYLREKSLASQACRVLDMPSDKMDVPALDDGLPVVYHVSSGNPPAANSAITFLTDKQLVSKTFMTYTVLEGELIEDTVIAYSNFWSQVYMDQFALRENRAVFSEKASDALGGIFTGAVQAVEAFDPGDGSGVGGNVLRTALSHFSSVSYDDLVALQEQIYTNAREGAIFVSNKAAWRWIRALRDDQGMPILHSSWSGLPSPQPVPITAIPRASVLLGDPYFLTEAMPLSMSTANQTCVLYGNFKQGHYFGDRKQLAVQWSSEAAFPSGGLAMRCRERFGVINVLTRGFAGLGTHS